MLNKERVKNSFYDCLVYSKTNRAVSVSVITDKQQLNAISLNNVETHDSISEILNLAINPDSNEFEENDNIYVALAGKNIFIDLPRSNHFSLSQYKFMVKLLDQIEQFIKENSNYEMMNIMIMSPKIRDEFLKIPEIKEKLKTLITQDISINSEIIIGNTLAKEDVIDSIKYNLNLESNITINELCSIINKCDILKKDTYYKQFIEELVPNLNEIDILVNLYYMCGLKKLVIENIDYSNIKEKLCLNLIKIFSNLTLERLQLINEYITKLNIDNINTILPNYSYISYLIKNIDKNSKEYLDSKLVNCNNYNEIVDVIIADSYKIETDKKNKCEQKLSSISDKLNNIMKNNNIVSNKEKVIELMNKRKELDSLIFEKEIWIENMDYHIKLGKENSTNVDKYVMQKEQLIEEVKKLKNEKAILQKELNDKYDIDGSLYTKNLINGYEFISLDEIKKEIESLKLEIEKSKVIINYIDNNYSINKEIYSDKTR